MEGTAKKFLGFPQEEFICKDPGKKMEDLRRVDEVADQDYQCERHLNFNRKSVYDEMVLERGDCLLTPDNIKKGANVVRFVGWGPEVRFHPECVYEHLREIEPS